MNNYRLISSIFDKIIEKIMHVRLYAFMEENNILFENQFGFRKQNSTVHALIQITEQIRSSIENGKYGCGIFIDLRKAFDSEPCNSFKENGTLWNSRNGSSMV